MRASLKAPAKNNRALCIFKSHTVPIYITQKTKGHGESLVKMRKYDHISTARQELHWLPIQQRIAFSILTDVYKALHGLAPTYITDLISLAQPARLTRSSKNFNIAFPVKVPRNSYGKQAFVHAAPTLWNNLPDSIRSSNSLLDFRRQLKTYFFTLAYNI